MSGNDLVQRKTLIELAHEFEDLAERMVQEHEQLGHVRPETEVAVSHVLLAQESKVDRCVGFMQWTKKKIELFEEEIEHLRKMVKREERKLEAMEGCIKTACDIGRVSKIEGSLGHSVRIQSYLSVQVEDEALIPEGWFDLHVTRKLRKKDLKNLLESGEVVPGAKLVAKPHVIIK